MTARGAYVGLWLLLLSGGTYARSAVWQSDRTLWADAVRQAPHKPRCILNDARSHELAGDDAYARDAYRRVIGEAFDLRRSAYIRRFTIAAAETNLAHLEMTAGHFATAMRILDGTIAQWPDFPYAHYNKGAIFWVVGACDVAVAEYTRARLGDPSLRMPSGHCEAHE